MDVPQSHVIMISFGYFLLKEFHRAAQWNDTVSLYLDGKQTQHLQWSATGGDQPAPALYEAREVHTRLKTANRIRWDEDTFGFQMVVTYHATDAKPEQVGHL